MQTIYTTFPSKYSPFAAMHFIQRSYIFLKTSWNPSAATLRSALFASSITSSALTNFWPFKYVFILGNRLKSQGARSGEYGVWEDCDVMFVFRELTID